MASIIALIILAVLHLTACGLWFFRGPLSVKDNLVLLPITVCLPLVGLMCAWRSSVKAINGIETPVSKLYKIVERDVLSVNAGKPELDTVVPFDEVLLLSNDRERREVMMHILRRDPFAYLEMLKAAKVSSDVEITHYATTTIMEIQRDLDINMQEAEAAYKKDSGNIDLVNRFINVLSSYINSGLLLENRMLQLQRQLSEILEHKIDIFPKTRSAHLLLISNEIDLGRYERAAEVAAMMREKWKEDEVSWLTSLRIYMIAGMQKEKADIAAQMLSRTDVIWSRTGREESEFLCGY